MATKTSYFQNNKHIQYIFLLIFFASLWVNADVKCRNWKHLEFNKKNWLMKYNGYGQIKFDNGLFIEPQAIGAKNGTHAALVISENKYKNFLIKMNYKNIKPLRVPAANPWEVFWFMFNYRPIDQYPVSNHKEANYFIFKPNGLELGKAWNRVDQQFLLTSTDTFANYNQNYQLMLYKNEQELKVYIDGKQVINFLGEYNHQLFNSEGHFGLYAEDSSVQLDNFFICQDRI